jgi:outer membrane protein TolC
VPPPVVALTLLLPAQVAVTAPPAPRAGRHTAAVEPRPATAVPDARDSAAAGDRRAAAQVAARPQAADTLPLLTLDEALRRARLHHPDYRAALARADAAGAGRLGAWGAFLPQLRASAGFNRYDIRNITFTEPEGSAGRLPEPIEATTFAASQGLSLTWELFGGGGRFFELGRARAAAHAGAHAADAAWWTAQAEVKRQYLEALRQERLAELARRLLDARRRDVEVAEARYRIATATEADVLGAQIEVARQEAQVHAAEAEAAKARERLAALCGLEPHRGFRLRDDFPDSLDLAALALDGLAEAAAHHPAVREAEAQADAAARTAWAQRARYLPSVSLSVGWGRSEVQGAEGDFFILDPRNRSTYVSLGASWSLFDGLRREADEARARAERDAARLLATKARREQEAKVRNALRDLEAADRRLRLAREALALARRRVEVARERYRMGSPDMPYWALQEVLRQATEAEREAVTARYDWLQAVAALESAAGAAVGWR